MPAPARLWTLLLTFPLVALACPAPPAAAADKGPVAPGRPSTRPATQPVEVTEKVEAGVLEHIIATDDDTDRTHGITLRVPRAIADPILEENDYFRVFEKPLDPFSVPWSIIVTDKRPWLLSSGMTEFKFKISRGGKDIVKPTGFKIDAKTDMADSTPEGQRLSGRVELNVPTSDRTYVIGLDALIRTRKHPQTGATEAVEATVTWRYPGNAPAAPTTRPAGKP